MRKCNPAKYAEEELQCVGTITTQLSVLSALHQIEYKLIFFIHCILFLDIFYFRRESCLKVYRQVMNLAGGGWPGRSHEVLKLCKVVWLLFISLRLDDTAQYLQTSPGLP